SATSTRPEPMPAVERSGRPAAPGLAAGPLVRLGGERVSRSGSGDPATERRDLEAAIAAAIAGISALIDRVEADAAEILEFQVAMLEDSVLSATAFDLIAAGRDAASSWIEGIAPQIADYESTEDEYFRARAADLADLRDRVLRALAGEADAELPAGSIVAGRDITPSRFLSIDWTAGGGVALAEGSPSSHVAMLARSRGVPMVVGLGAFDTPGHAEAILDADRGRLILDPG